MNLKWIIIGYFLTFFKIHIIIDLLGYLFILYGLYLIRKQNIKFLLALIPIFIISIFISILFIDFAISQLNIDFSITGLLDTKYLNYITFLLLNNSSLFKYSIIYSLFAVLLFLGISDKAKKIGYNKLSTSAKNLCFLIVFYTLITTIPFLLVLPPVIYTILIFIISLYELFVIFDARRLR